MAELITLRNRSGLPLAMHSREQMDIYIAEYQLQGLYDDASFRLSQDEPNDLIFFDIFDTIATSSRVYTLAQFELILQRPYLVDLEIVDRVKVLMPFLFPPETNGKRVRIPAAARRVSPALQQALIKNIDDHATLKSIISSLTTV